jgi:cellulose synthase operon protein C
VTLIPSPLVAVVVSALLLAACGGESPEQMLASAKASLAGHEPKAAIVHLKNLLQKAPKSAEARLLMGQALLDSGDSAGATVELRKALDLGVSESETLPVLARALLAHGEHRALLEAYARTDLPDRAAQADLKATIAAAYMKGKELDRARAAVNAALIAVPDHVPARLLHARLTWAGGDAAAALQAVQRLVADAPANLDAWVLLGDLLTSKEPQPEPAIAAYRKALALNGAFLPAHVGILHAQLGRQDFAGAQAQYELLKAALPQHRQTYRFGTVLAMQRRDFKTAHELSERLLAAAPFNVDHLRLAGAVALQSGEWTKAEGHFASALKAAPANPMLRRLLAATYLQMSQPDKTLATLRPLLDEKASDPAVLALAATAQAQLGDLAKSQALFARAAKLQPTDEHTRVAVALGRLRGPDGDVALAELQGTAATADSIQVDLALIGALVQRKEFDKALQAVAVLERKQPASPVAAAMRGRVHAARGDQAAARSSFERALEITPAYYPATAALAGFDLRDGKPEAAIQRFETLLQRDPKSVPALLALADLRGRSPGGAEQAGQLLSRAVLAGPEQAGTRVLLIDHHLRLGAVKPALATAQDAMAALPGEEVLIDALGRAQLASGDANQALTTFNQLATLKPGSPLPQIRLAQAQMALKNSAAARQSLDRALTIKPGDLAATQALIGLQIAQGEPQQALALARDLQRQTPQAAAGHALEGDLQASLKKWDAAAAAYRTALKLEPRRNDLAIKLHAALGAGGKPDEAEAFAVAYLKAQPEDAAFLLYLGERAMVRREYAAAEARFQAVARLDPAHASAQNNIAWLMVMQKKPGALPFAERANTLAPNQPVFLDTLATVLAYDNQLGPAVDVQKKALLLQPDNPALRLHLAQLYLRAGDKPLARSELEQLARLGNKFAGQQQVGELMKSL